MKDKHSIVITKDEKTMKECCVCLENLNESYMLYPCGHAQYCKLCAMKLEQCSLCRKNITDRIKVHF